MRAGAYITKNSTLKYFCFHERLLSFWAEIIYITICIIICVTIHIIFGSSNDLFVWPFPKAIFNPCLLTLTTEITNLQNKIFKHIYQENTFEDAVSKRTIFIGLQNVHIAENVSSGDLDILPYYI